MALATSNAWKQEKAWDEGAWVREAAEAYTKKKKSRTPKGALQAA